jgi:hypothetical protein
MEFIVHTPLEAIHKKVPYERLTDFPVLGLVNTPFHPTSEAANIFY